MKAIYDDRTIDRLKAKLQSGKYFLGRLCDREHAWEDTGLSVRYRAKPDSKSSSCVICEKDRQQKRFLQQRDRLLEKAKLERKDPELRSRRLEIEQKYLNSEKGKQTRSNYENSEHGKDVRRRFSQSNSGKAVLRRYWSKPESREKRKIWSQQPEQKEKRKLYAQSEAGKAAAKRKSDKHRKTEKHRFTRRVYMSRQRALRRQNHQVKTPQKQIKERLNAFNGKCAYCREECLPTLDHFIPISKGGADCLGNYVPACKRCNTRKSNRDSYQWYKSQPFFSKKAWKEILALLNKSEKDLHQIPLF